MRGVSRTQATIRGTVALLMMVVTCSVIGASEYPPDAYPIAQVQGAAHRSPVDGRRISGVLGVVPGIIGMLQALEVIKLATGIGEPLIGRLLLFDARGTRFRELALGADGHCRYCSPEQQFPGYDGASCATACSTPARADD
mgnify:CR=1 FL=1